MNKRVRLQKDSSKSQSMTKAQSMTLASTRCALFDEAHLLEGEDAAIYQELLAHIRGAVRPADIIDEMLIADVASLEWEVLAPFENDSNSSARA